MTRRAGRAALQQHLKNTRKPAPEPWAGRDTTRLRANLAAMSRHEVEEVWTRLLKQRWSGHVRDATQLVLERIDWHDWPRMLKALDADQHVERLSALIAAGRSADGEPPRLALTEALTRLEWPGAEAWFSEQLREGSVGLKQAALRGLAVCGTRRSLWAVIEASQTRALAAAAAEARAAIERREPEDALARAAGGLSESAAGASAGALSAAGERGALSSADEAERRPARRAASSGGILEWRSLGVGPRALSWRVWARILYRAHGAVYAVGLCAAAAVIVTLTAGTPWWLGLIAVVLAAVVPAGLGLRRLARPLKLLREGHPTIARPDAPGPLSAPTRLVYTTASGAFQSMSLEGGARLKPTRVLYIETASFEAEHATWQRVSEALLGEGGQA
jgi:hypothetical protein